MKKIDQTMKADDLWSIYGNFGMVKGEVYGDHACFYTEGNKYRVSSEREADENGVVLQKGTLKNTSESPISVNYLMSKFVFDGGEYEVYTQSNTWQNESLGSWQPLVSGVTGETQGIRDCFGAAPFFVLWNKQTDRGRAFHILASCAWKYSILRTPYTEGGEATKVEVEIGINNRNFCMELGAGEELKLPEIIYYDVRNKTDLDCYKLHNYMNKIYPRKEMPVLYNTWLYQFEKINFENVISQVSKAAELGVEYFVIDAGWYGEGNFWNCRGDWEECQTGGLEGRMRELSDIVREHGMKFGFWLEIESGGADAKIVSDHSEFFFKYDDMILFDFANPQACDYIVDKVCSLIEKYDAKFVKFDFNQDTRLDQAKLSFLKYFEGYRSVLMRIRKAFPDLYMENCASGGLRMSLENGKCFDSFWYSDNQSPYEGMRIYKDTIRRMPPQWIERWASIQSVSGLGEVYLDTPKVDKIISTNDATWMDVRGVLPSYLEGFLTGSPIGFSCDLNRLSKEHFERIRDRIAEIKLHREFWKKAVCRILADTESLLVLQYSDNELNRIEILVFTQRIRQRKVCVYPVLDVKADYKMNDAEICSGSKLDTHGIDVILQGNYQMERVKLCSLI